VSLTRLGFLLLVGAVLPYLAIQSGRRLDAGEPPPPRRRLFAQTLALQGFLLAAALATAAAEGLTLFRAPDIGLEGAAAGLALLGVALGTLPRRWRRRPVEQRRRVLALVPGASEDWPLYAAVCTAAACAEEIAYRGVMFAIVQSWTGGWWAAAATCALAFAAGHAAQGRRAAAAVFVMAMGMHGLVRISGGLEVAIAVHFLYDVGAGYAIGWLGRSDAARS
jgi:membrane protease YdiL (CAAX protease family)